MTNEMYETIDRLFDEAVSRGYGESAVDLVGGGVSEDASINEFAGFYPIGELVARSYSTDKVAVYTSQDEGMYIAIGNVNGPWAVRFDYQDGMIVVR